MKRSFVAIMLLLSGPAFAQNTFTVAQWPDDADKVPCEAWKKEADGRIVQTGTIIANGVRRADISLRSSKEADMVERKCFAPAK